MDILSNAPAQYGALGLLIVSVAQQDILENVSVQYGAIAILLAGIAALWRQLIKERQDAKKELAAERDARDNERERHRQEFFKLNEGVLLSHNELRSLLRDLVDERNTEALLKEYIKKE